MPVPLRDLTGWIDAYLDIASFEDASLNGLQVEGNPQVSKVALGVDASLAAITAAVEGGADLLLVHHGLFWGQVQPATGPLARRLAAALGAGLSLYAAHLPLDAHPEVGNNACLADLLGLVDRLPFGAPRGKPIGVAGRLPARLPIDRLADALQRITGEVCLVHRGGPEEVERLALLSGGGARFVAEAALAGMDTLVTGEPEHAHFHDPFEWGINAVYAGHYDTEVFGVRSLGARLSERFGLPCSFIPGPTGL